MLIQSSERKQAEEALRESEERYRALIENGHDIIVILDPETGRIRYQSPSMERILGYAPGDLAERSVFDLVHPDDLPGGLAAIAGSVANPGITRSAECRFLHRNGSWRRLETFGRTLMPDSAEGGLVFNTRDITERKTAEDALHTANHTLQSIFDAAPLAVLSFDLQGRVTHWSAGAERLFGWTAAEALGRICVTVPEENVADFLAMVARVASGGVENLVRVRQKKNGQRIEATGGVML